MDFVHDIKRLSGDTTARVALLLVVILTIWWVTLSPLTSTVLVSQKNLWSSSYEFLSLLGGISGILISRYWGGYKSVFGRAILAFSIGLLLQTFGQTIYNYYTLFLKVETPYPSLGDVGYFGSIPAYIYGVVLLGKVSGLKFSFRRLHNQLLAFFLPLLMLIVSYMIFLKGYQFDFTHPLTIFLDFGYPLGQAIYVSLAILVLLASRSFLGGIMKKPIILILIALTWQYICDFNFLYQANHGNWYAGGMGDYMYVISYFLMTIALVYTGICFKQIRTR